MQMETVETNVGSGYLLCAVEYCANQRLSHRQIAMCVLYRYGCIVYKDPDSQRHPAKRHHVDRVTEQLQDCDRNQHG